MWCPACGSKTKQPLCRRCADACRRAPERWAGTILVRAAFVHHGPAQRLVHELKYRASPRAADVLAQSMATLVDPAASALIPVPRSLARRWRYGVDPGVALAYAMSRHTGVPVVRALRPPLGHRSNAGVARAQRRPPRFVQWRSVEPGSVLVDDVVTTGSTVRAAAAALSGSVGLVVTATSALGVTSLRTTE